MLRCHWRSLGHDTVLMRRDIRGEIWLQRMVWRLEHLWWNVRSCALTGRSSMHKLRRGCRRIILQCWLMCRWLWCKMHRSRLHHWWGTGNVIANWLSLSLGWWLGRWGLSQVCRRLASRSRLRECLMCLPYVVIRCWGIWQGLVL